MEFKDVFTEKRRSLGLSQNDVAEKLFVTRQAVSRWECGDGYPDIELIPPTANFFHVSVDELFGCGGEREERIRAEERARMESEAVKASMKECAGFDDSELPFEQPSTVTAYYKVIATEEELEQVEMAFNSIGIYFERRDA